MSRAPVFAVMISLSSACAASDPRPINDTSTNPALSTGPLPENLHDARSGIAEAYALVDIYGEGLFASWRAAPKDVMLIDEQTAWLFCRPKAPPGWVQVDEDARTGCSISRAPARHPKNRRATVTFEGRPTVIIGTPKALGLSRERFVLALVHERLHQLQMSSPDYEAAVLALGLHNGDPTEQWIRQYSFPYQDRKIRTALRVQATTLAIAVRLPLLPKLTKYLPPRAGAYFSARRETMALLTPDDDRYAELQLWRYGVARYAELAIATEASGRGTLDYVALAKRLRTELIEELYALSPAEQGPDIFYALGAGEALLLDQVRPQWRAQYLTERFTFAKWFVK